MSVPSLFELAQNKMLALAEQQAPSKLDPVCATVLKRYARELGQLPRVPDGGAGGFAAKDWTYCWPTSDGAWAVEPLGMHVVTEHAWPTAVGRWTIIHVDRSGAIRRGPSRKLSADPASGHSFQGELFDFDGDGHEEIVLSERWGGHTGSGWADGHVWTFAHGAVRRYPTPFRRVVDAFDFDEDGRPDLISDAGFEGDTGALICDDSFQAHTSSFGPYLIAHALPDGSFSVDDRLAELAARSRCPLRPTLGFTPADMKAAGEVLRRIRCARLWGTRTSEIVRAVRAVCQRPPTPQHGEICYPHAPGVCAGMRTMLRWARVRPRLVLHGAIVCRHGMVASYGRCCWPGQIWSETEHDCRGTPTSCPPGYSQVAGDCRHDDTPIHCSPSPLHSAGTEPR